MISAEADSNDIPILKALFKRLKGGNNLICVGTLLTINNPPFFIQKESLAPIGKTLYLYEKIFSNVVPPRIELGTHGFSVRCSTN